MDDEEFLQFIVLACVILIVMVSAGFFLAMWVYW